MKKLILISISLVLPTFVVADDGLGCLRKLQGKIVRWDGDWQKDRADTDVRYQINNVSDGKFKGGQPEVTLQLQAVGPATIANRTSKIRMDYAAEMFCQRVENEEKKIPKLTPVLANSDKEPVKFSPGELPFRIFYAGRWIPARPPVGEQTKVCISRNSLFSCSTADYATWEKSSGQLLGRGKLGNPLIRFRDGGWVRGSEADLNRIGRVKSCKVMGREFSCFEEEQNAYSVQLEQLRRRKI